MELPQELEKAHEVIRGLQQELEKKNNISKDFQNFRKMSEEEKQKLTDSERLLQEQIESMQSALEVAQKSKTELEQRYEKDRRSQVEMYRDRKIKDIAKGDEKFLERLRSEYDVLNLADDNEVAIDARLDRAYQAASKINPNEIARMNAAPSAPAMLDAENIAKQMTPEATSVYDRMFGGNK